MRKNPPVRVALDLETTGLHAEQDAILEVAAIKFQGDTILDTLDTLVTPGRAIPYRIQRLTGITLQDVTSAPRLASITDRLRLFIGNFPLVGHSIPFDAGFLRRCGLGHTNPLIDTFELASLLLPSLPSYNLGQVAQALNISATSARHRAMTDTMLAMQVFLALQRRLQEVDSALLYDVLQAPHTHNWPLLTFLRQELLQNRQGLNSAQNALQHGSLGDHFATQLAMDPRIFSFSIADYHAVTPSHEKAEQHYSHADITSESKNESGMSAQDQTRYREIYTSLEQGTPLMVEATVGDNAYAPVVLPALEWVAVTPSGDNTSPRRLVIACANQQNASRLVEHVLPGLQESLKIDLSVAYLAENGGYLCTHRLFGAALPYRYGDMTAEQARGFAKVRLWAQQTRTGERGELTFLPPESTIWQHISSGIECLPGDTMLPANTYEHCTYRQKGYCFASRAEERVKTATIVVTTHAGLLDNLSQPTSLLHSIDRRLILDAELLEDETARWSTTELDKERLIAILNMIGLEMPGNRYQGLLALVPSSSPGDLSSTYTVNKSELDTRALSRFQILQQTRAAVEHVFSCFGRLLEEFQQQGASRGERNKGKGDATGYGKERIDQPLRLRSNVHALEAWTNVEHAWQQLAHYLQAVIDLIHEAVQTLTISSRSHRGQDAKRKDAESIRGELALLSGQLRTYIRLGQEAMALGENNMVYWLRMPSFSPTMPNTSPPSVAPSPVLYSQLAHISPLLKQVSLSPDACTIFVGTALSVDNSFSFSRTRFGLDDDGCPTLSVVPERHKQTLIYLPEDIPEPNMPQYQRHLDDAIIHLARALDGRLVVLFTSHAALRSSYASIKATLEASNILVLGQGVDGSPRQLWHIFHEQEQVVLLGTGTFWDSAEEIKTTPACIFIARLPMPILNDPPVAARADHYTDQLHQWTVPMASLRLRRALNQFAWSDTKRNTVVLFDRRITSKDYGATILNSLPHCSQQQKGVLHMPETILDWLTTTDSWE